MIDERFIHLPKERQNKKLKKLYSDPLFRVLYIPLWYQSKNDLTPVEIWQEALMVLDEMKNIDRTIRHLEVTRIIEELNSRYSSFDDIERNENDAAHTSMMVMATAMFMLGEANEDWFDNPHQRLCSNIGNILSRIKGYKELCNEVKKSERITIEKEGPLPVRDFMGEEKKSTGYDNLPTFTEEEISTCGIKAQNTEWVLQAISIVRKDIIADNDWVAVYAVLLERGFISATMTTFCSMINRLFNVNIRSRYLSGVLRDHGTDIGKWSSHYEDQKRHKLLAKKFDELLDIR